MKLKSLKTNPTSSRFLTFSCVSIIIHPLRWFYVWPGVPASGLFFCLCRFLKPLFSGLFQITPHSLALLFCHHTGFPVRIFPVAVRIQRAVFDLASIGLASIPTRALNAFGANCLNGRKRFLFFHFPLSLQVSLQPCSGTSHIASCRATTSWLWGMASSAEMR